MVDEFCPKSPFRRLAGVFSLLGALGCSATSSTIDGPRSRLNVRAPSEVTWVSHDAGVPAAPASTSVAFSNPDENLDAFDSSAPNASATLLHQENHPALDPLPEPTYRLPLGDMLTTRKAMATYDVGYSPRSCRMELRRRRIPFFPIWRAVGIVDPMRFSGNLRGIRFVMPGPKSVHSLLDCRLLLLLDDLSGVLASQGVTTVYVDGMYRPRAHLPGKKALSQHALGLAIDIDSFGMKDGRTLSIERDFGGAIGSPVCGEAATVQPESKASVELRNLVCAIARAKAFHYLLTPNHDQAHVNHIHGDIKSGARAHVVR